MWRWPEHREPPCRHAELMPGGLSVVGSGWILQTLVGSCVSVVLWDPVSRKAGMCHYVLTHRAGDVAAEPDGDGLNGRYGTEALHLLKDLMGPVWAVDRESRPTAHVVGGAALLAAEEGRAGVIGKSNVALALKWVEQEGLRLGELHVGGLVGRRVSINTDTGALSVTAVAEVSPAWPVAPLQTSMWVV